MGQISIIFRVYLKIKHFLWYIFNKHSFRSIEISSLFQSNIRFDGRENISIGKDVVVQRGSWLGAVPLTGKSCLLEIKNGTIIGNYNHIYATSRIVIEESVLLADKVYISDCAHNYEDINLPIIKQGVKQLSEITIGTGSWLGENVCIIGASVGKHCVIGANSVVTHDIPDYSIAVGSPAQIKKTYNFKTQKWERI